MKNNHHASILSKNWTSKYLLICKFEDTIKKLKSVKQLHTISFISIHELIEESGQQIDKSNDEIIVFSIVLLTFLFFCSFWWADGGAATASDVNPSITQTARWL